jgi:phenylalanyl-tRNA synthetase beta chain
MRVPLSWLGEYVSLPANVTPETVMAELVKVGLEEEGSHSYQLTGPIVVGEVLEFVEEPQSNGKTIRWCQVRVGLDDVRGIVCGARNFEVGDKVVVTLPGAVLPGDFKIAARSTYGHTSDGMIASARELGISDDHEGILRLKTIGLDPEVGSDALDLLQLNDSAAEVNVTPDRGYCFSIRGIAREYSHATGASFTDPVSRVIPVAASGFEVNIDNSETIRGIPGVSKFVTRVIRDVDANAPTPTWMVSRLKLAGMRSISVVVDITNYVMLELGQPIHAYDLAKVGNSFGVRRAKANEVLETLDGVQRKLDPEDLVIVDSSGPIGLAGVMGGASTEVGTSTRDLLIEAANFDGVSISRTARRHKLPSEASKRFERGVDPKVAEYAAARVVQLLEEFAGGKADQLGSVFDESEEPSSIFLPGSFASELTGVNYATEDIKVTLEKIGCQVVVSDDGFEVVAPSWRPDLSHKTDLVEEIARILGYEQIPSRLPVAPPGRGLTKRQKLRRLVANYLAASGQVEVLNYPFLSSEQNEYFTSDATSKVKLANAMQEEINELRLSLLPGLLDAAKRNLSRNLVDLSIFEIGLVFQPASSVEPVSLPDGTSKPSEGDLAKLFASVPLQPLMLGGLFIGERTYQQVGRKATKASYADAITVVRNLAQLLSVELTVEQAEPKGFHPGRSAELKVGEQVIGYAGEVHPELAMASDLPRQVAVFEINLDDLFNCVPETVVANAIRTYPAATQDLSLVLDSSIPAAQVLKTIWESAGELLEEVILVDDFRGGNLAENEKSLTFALRFRASDRTLTQAEASQARDQAVAEANRRFSATLRA